jgi:hypothetical protein
MENHASVSVIASTVVVGLTRSSVRWLAWAAVLAVGVLTFVFALRAVMSTSGDYL